MPDAGGGLTHRTAASSGRPSTNSFRPGEHRSRRAARLDAGNDHLHPRHDRCLLGGVPVGSARASRDCRPIDRSARNGSIGDGLGALGKRGSPAAARGARVGGASTILAGMSRTRQRTFLQFVLVPNAIIPVAYAAVGAYAQTADSFLREISAVALISGPLLLIPRAATNATLRRRHSDQT